MSSSVKRARGKRAWLLVPALAVVAVISGLLGAAIGARQGTEPSPMAEAPAVLPPRATASGRPSETAATTALVGTAGQAAHGAAAAIRAVVAQELAPKFHPRDPREWQGMLVDLSRLQPFCRSPADCGLALGCRGPSEGCGPCIRDEHCGPGETCVLDHCVLESRVRCRSYRDCAPGVLCFLSGISPDPRGNAEMIALCADAVEHQPERPVVEEEPPAQKREPAMPFELLRRRIGEGAPGR